MKIEVIKPNESAWRFPCMGISSINNMIVGFSSYGIGVVLDIGLCNDFNLYGFSKDWKMSDFEPIEEEKEVIDWDKVKFPIWAKDKFGQLIQIISVKKAEIKYYKLSDNITFIPNLFPTQTLAKQWLDSLEILPNGTEIKIIT